MPYEFTFNGKERIFITYDADGNKLRKEVFNAANVRTSLHDYVNGVEYENNVLEFMNFGFTRMAKDNAVANTYRMEYTLADHLGNNRVTFTDKNGDGRIDDQEEVVQENHFYAYGMQMEGNWNVKSVVGSPKQNYRYNASEWTTELGLNWEDHGARYYAPALGVWNGIDALAESYTGFSPFHFVMGNPISYGDPTGMGAEGYITGASGKLYFDKNIHSQAQIDNRYGVNSGYRYRGEDIIGVYQSNGNRYYGDKNGVFTAMSREDAVVTAYKPTIVDKCGACPTTVNLGMGLTGSLPAGGQSGVDVYWITKGRDKSIFPYIVGNYGTGVGYNIDTDVHAGLGWTTGNNIDEVTADGLLNTSWNPKELNPFTSNDGQGFIISGGASFVAELGANYAHSKVGPNTGYHNVSLSAGMSMTPGINAYFGRYGSQNIGRLDIIIKNYVMKQK